MDSEFSIKDVDLKGEYFSQEPPGNKAELFFPVLLKSAIHEIDCTFSSNMKMFVFTRSAINFSQSKIYFTMKDDEMWKKPKQLVFEKSNYVSGAVFSHSSDEMYLNYFDKETQPRMTIHSSKLENNDWMEPKSVDNINIENFHSAFPSIAKNGNIYFHSNRTTSLGGFDIYFSEFYEGKFSSPRNLGSQINSNLNEFHPFIDPEERYIIFDVQGKDGSIGGQDLYISFNLGEEGWSLPENLGKEINSTAADFRARVTPDRKYILFSSNRKTDTTQPGIQNLYWANAHCITDLQQKYS